MKTYESQKAWKKIQSALPASLHFGPGNQPVEEFWACQGHQIHLDRFRNPKAPVRIVQFHGVGTNGRQMSMIVGGPLAKLGYETVAVDMPGYGMTKVKSGHLVEWGDWVNIASEFIDTELAADPRPIVLYGLSAGGMLAYHAAAKNPKVAGIVGMSFLEQRNQQVRDETALNLLMSRAGGPAARIAARTPLAFLKMPMWLASKMHALVNDRKVLRVFLSDRTSAGNWASMKFLGTMMTYTPAIEPEAFDVCPILLTQPGEDRWTPLHLSELFLSRLKNKAQVVILDNAGHYPLEQPGLDQMHRAIVDFVSKVK